jgi:hypothetical protein
MEMKMKKQNFKVVALVPSDSNPRRAYKIRRHPKGLMCSCMSFRFAVGEFGSATKTCKHLRSVAA